MTTPTKPVPGVSGMQGNGHLPAAERAAHRADRAARRKAADALAVKEEAARNPSPPKEPAPRAHAPASHK